MVTPVDLICPNCGGLIKQKTQERLFPCPVCERELELIPPHKLIIADPLPDYYVRDRTTTETVAPLGATTPMPKWESSLSPQRRKRNSILVHERLAQERINQFKASWMGIWSILLGLGTLGLGWLRQNLLPPDWITLGLVAFGVISLVGGIVLTIRFYYTARTITESDPEPKEIQFD